MESKKNNGKSILGGYGGSYEISSYLETKDRSKLYMISKDTYSKITRVENLYIEDIKDDAYNFKNIPAALLKYDFYEEAIKTNPRCIVHIKEKVSPEEYKKLHTKAIEADLRIESYLKNFQTIAKGGFSDIKHFEEYSKDTTMWAEAAKSNNLALQYAPKDIQKKLKVEFSKLDWKKNKSKSFLTIASFTNVTNGGCLGKPR